MEYNDITKFIIDLNKLGYKNPFNLNEIVIDDYASFEFKFYDDNVYITNVTVYDTRHEVATKCFNKIIKLVDKYSITLIILPFILEDTGLTDTEFLNWINDYDFDYVKGKLIRKS